MGGPPLASLKHKLAGLALFLLISILLFGLRVVWNPAGAQVGFISDPSAMIWCIAWWPHAIANGLNPFITHAIWTPVGYNLTWATSIPGIALIFAPVTALFGPVVSYNCAALAAPALSGWAGYLLCRRLTTNVWAAFSGGLLYGFSPYEVGHIVGGHLSLTPIFIPPLCVLFFLSLVHNRISARRFVAGLALLLILPFLISNEIFATMTVFGAAALTGAMIFFPTHRPRLLRTIAPLACSY